MAGGTYARGDWGEPPWRIDVEIAPAPPPSACDVAIIGGGFTGLSAAYHLARRGVRVAVLEAARLGDGASGRTGGLALEGTANGPRPGAERCLEFLRTTTSDAGIDCDLDLRGCWELAHAREPRDGPLDWPDGDGRLQVERTVAGGTLDPGALVAGLARAALAAGATIHEHTPVTSVEAGAGVSLRTPHGMVRSGHALTALNGYTGELLPEVKLRAPLTLALCTAPLDPTTWVGIGLGERTPFYTVDLPYLWGRHLAGDRLIIGAGLAFADDGTVRHVDVREPQSRTIFATLERRLRQFHPLLAEVEITHRWGGPIAFREGGLPLLGRAPGSPRLLITGAYAGHGVALSVQAGAHAAAAILDGTPLPIWGAIEAR